MLDSVNKDTLYSNFHPKKKQSPSKRLRMKTDAGRSVNLDLMSPSISRYRSNMSVVSDKHSNRDKSRLIFNYDSQSIRGYPSESETRVKFQKKMLKDKQFENWDNKYRLYFESIQLNLYGVDMQNKKAVVKFLMNDKSESKKLELKYEST